MAPQCSFGEIDAFVSHSWLDPAAAKAHHLMEWFAAKELAGTSTRAERPTGSATEPLLWIDVACLSQFTIERDLPCLPFYILASKQFVGLVGPHFPHRLWCILEVFFFFELRRGQSAPCVFLDLGSEQADSDREHVSRFGAFDADKAQCTVPEDRDHLLAIIESSFGGLQHFNRIVRSLKLS